MKKIILLLSCLWMMSGTAHAAWTMLKETRDGILYVDKDAAETVASGFKVLSSEDFHVMQNWQGKEYLTAKSWFELDCTGKKIRQLSFEIFPENMAGGGSLYADSKILEWVSPPAGSKHEAIWNSLCGKK